MKCPKCDGMMEKVSVSAGVVDRCTKCMGLWLDNLEHQEMKSFAAAVDIGDAAVGAQYNEVDNIKCPVCPNSKLIRMVDPKQSHIWFESCPTCYGRFFDAGEFRDLAQHTLGDFFKGLFAKARD